MDYQKRSTGHSLGRRNKCRICNDILSRHYAIHEKIDGKFYEYGGHRIPCHICKPEEYAIEYEKHLTIDRARYELNKDRKCCGKI